MIVTLHEEQTATLNTTGGYKCNGTPIPSFEGEPLRVTVDDEDPDKFAVKLWKALNEDNKVSLFVRAIDLATQTFKDVIINKYKVVEG